MSIFTPLQQVKLKMPFNTKKLNIYIYIYIYIYIHTHTHISDTVSYCSNSDEIQTNKICFSPKISETIIFMQCITVKVRVCHTIVYCKKCMLKTTMNDEFILILQFVKCLLSLFVL